MRERKGETEVKKKEERMVLRREGGGRDNTTRNERVEEDRVIEGREEGREGWG